MKYTIYFAGALFSHKELVGNHLLARAIENESEYRCILPQNLEQLSERSVDIRNTDLKAVMECDLCIFNFDGSELDSGTVVEFMFAKLLDIPGVLLRTDFRAGGDQQDDQWNLMCSGYPRSESLIINAMQAYHIDFTTKGIEAYYQNLAGPVIEALDKVRSLPPVLRENIDEIYNWAVKFPGSGLQADIPAIIKRKKSQGLL